MCGAPWLQFWLEGLATVKRRDLDAAREGAGVPQTRRVVTLDLGLRTFPDVKLSRCLDSNVKKAHESGCGMLAAAKKAVLSQQAVSAGKIHVLVQLDPLPRIMMLLVVNRALC